MMSLLLMKVFGGGAACCANALGAKVAVNVTAINVTAMMDVWMIDPRMKASRYQPVFFDPADKLMLCIQSFVIKTPPHTILVDACVGNHKPRPTRPFWHMMNSDRFEKGLEAAGVSVNDIDYVMCTHL